MPRPKTTGPTDRELAILHILWETGPCTVREVHQELQKEHDVGYTSVQKIMQIMFDKGLVERDERTHSHIYTAAHSKESTQEAIALDLLERVFGGSAMNLVARALSAKPTSDEELEQIKNLLQHLKEEHRDQ
jgi:BlaI family penicillinase repressor